MSEWPKTLYQCVRCGGVVELDRLVRGGYRCPSCGFAVLRKAAKRSRLIKTTDLSEEQKLFFT
jgi:DNA-directed RNA polymerase subunit RPC12/RpoP